VSIVLSPAQIGSALADTLTVGLGKMKTVTVSKASHPAAFSPLTAYWVVTAGLTVRMLLVVITAGFPTSNH
jgi:hypothetical protein